MALSMSGRLCSLFKKKPDIFDKKDETNTNRNDHNRLCIRNNWFIFQTSITGDEKFIILLSDYRLVYYSKNRSAL